MRRSMLFAFYGLALLATLAACLWLFLPRPLLWQAAMAVERLRAGLSVQTLVIDGRRISYLDGGPRSAEATAGTAPILLLHGSSGEKDNWNRVARHLTGQYRVIAIDLPGFGDSERLPGLGSGLQDQLTALQAIITALGLRQFHIGGNSMGGRIAALHAAAHPDAALSLWLPGPSGVLSATPSDLQIHLLAGRDNPLFIRQTEAYDAYLHWLMRQPPGLPRRLKQAMADRALHRADYHRQIFDAIGTETRSLEEMIHGMRVPARIVWGDRDRIWDVSGAQKLVDVLPRGSLLLLPGLGHLPMIEAPHTVAADYLAFLKPLTTH